MLNNLKGYKQQADALVGLALHILQDHFAHRTDVKVYTTYIKGGNINKYEMFFAGTATDYSQLIGNTSDFEDNTKVLPWRYNKSVDITKKIYDFYKKNKKINKIYKKFIRKNKKKVNSSMIYFHYNFLIVEANKFKIVIE